MGEPTTSQRSWRSGTPWRVALATMVLASGFVFARLQMVAEGDIGTFVVAGSVFADPASPPKGVPVLEGYGYDGQFFWRLANDPFDLHRPHNEGVRIDTYYRTQRLGYPVLAWAVTGGGRADVAWALVIINIASLGALAALAAGEARRYGRTGWLGLAVAMQPAFLYSTARDLSEPMACALLLAALVALRRGRWGWAAAAFSVAVLTREQIVVIVAVYGLSRLWSMARDRSWPNAADLPWVVPGAVFLLLQLGVWAETGHLPMGSTRRNLGLPFAGLVPAIGDMLGYRPALEHPNVGGASYAVVAEQLRGIPELALLAALVVVALSARLPRSLGWERAAAAVLTFSVISLAAVVWRAPADLRTITDLAVLCWAIALAAASPRVLYALGVATLLVALLPAWSLIFVV